MNAIGYLLIAAGFVSGAFFAVESVEDLRWGLWGLCVGSGVVGVVLVRTGSSKSAKAEHRLTADMKAIEASLGSLVEKVSRLNAEKASIDPYDVRHRIDAELMADLDTFVQARESLSHRYGIQAYADVMTSFATGERYLNRCWSCSADGYVDEIHTYLGKAEEQLREARSKLEEVKAA